MENTPSQTFFRSPTIGLFSGIKKANRIWVFTFDQTECEHKVGRICFRKYGSNEEGGSIRGESKIEKRILWLEEISPEKENGWEEL